MNLDHDIQTLLKKAKQSIGTLTEEEISYFQESGITKLFPILCQGLCHRTSFDNFKSILLNGYIKPNTGCFSFSYPQTQHSYTFSKGYISLFDFGSTELENCIDVFKTWQPFLFDFKPLTIVICLNRQNLNKKLIPNSGGPEIGSKEYKIFIPYVEAWYPGPIPVSAIQSIICISSNRDQNHEIIFKEITLEGLKHHREE